MDDCSICKHINMIKEGTNNHFVTELETGYVIVGRYQYFEGYTLFLCKEHKNEIHDLDPEFNLKFLLEMSIVSEAVLKPSNPTSLITNCLVTEAHICTGIFSRDD